jgi:hypothetical protein
MEPSPHARILERTLMGSAPQGQLPLAVHVAPRFAEGKQGRALVTVKLEEGGVHEGAISLVLATVDEAGRVGNQWQGRMLPPPDGEPWEVTTELTLPRGRHQLRVAGVSADGTRTGLVLTSVEIVETGRELEMTPPVLLDVTAGQVHPTAVRTFASGDPLGVQVEIGGRRVQQRVGRVRAALLDRDGRTVREVDAVLDPAPKSDRIAATAILKTGGIDAGEYVLITDAQVTGAEARLRRAIPITLRDSEIAAPRAPAGAPPDAVALSTPPTRPIPHTVVAHGPTSWHSGPGTSVIRTEQEWAAFWKQLPTRRMPLPVDFARVTLLAIVLETDVRSAEKPVVTRIELEAGTTIVHWETAAAVLGNDAATSTPLHPFIVVALTGEVREVRFERGGVR